MWEVGTGVPQIKEAGCMCVCVCVGGGGGEGGTCFITFISLGSHLLCCCILTIVCLARGSARLSLLQLYCEQ